MPDFIKDGDSGIVYRDGQAINEGRGPYAKIKTQLADAIDRASATMLVENVREQLFKAIETDELVRITATLVASIDLLCDAVVKLDSKKCQCMNVIGGS